MEKILKFEKTPQMDSVAFYSDYLSVLVAHGYDINNILINNYLTLYYTPNYILSKNPVQIGFRRFSYIKKLFICKKLNIDYKHPIDSICTKINENKYIEIILKINFLFEEGLSAEALYHNMMIYGYDTTKKIFYVASYFPIQKNISKYQTFTITFEEFLEALPGPKTKTGFEKNLMYNHVFYLPKNFNVENIKYGKIIFDLVKYMLPFPPIFFNHSVCKRYAKYLSKNSSRLEVLDLRNLIVLNDHKKILYSLACVCSKDDNLINEIKIKIVDKSFIILLESIKYNLTQKKEIMGIVEYDLKELYKNEKNLLLRLLKELIKGKIYRNEKDSSNSKKCL